MPDFDVISDVSETLRQTLVDALAGTPLGGTIVRVDNLADGISTNPAHLTIFLYELAEDSSQRNRSHRRTEAGGTLEIRKPPMALLLRYLVTAWAGDMATEQSLLGRTLQVLYDGAILSGTQLQGSLVGTGEAVKVTLVPLTLEEKSRVWYAIQKPYRLSLNYEVRVVNLDPTSFEVAMPVTSRILEPAVPGTSP
jgi:hypothetical protein